MAEGGGRRLEERGGVHPLVELLGEETGTCATSQVPVFASLAVFVKIKRVHVALRLRCHRRSWR